MKFLNKYGHFIIILFFVGLYFLYFQHLPFLGDFVQLSSLQAHFFYDNSFHGFLLPDEIDSGHLPGMGFLLSILWKIFGRELWVGHALMLMVSIGIVIQIKKLLQQFVPEFTFIGTILLLSDATFLGQSSQVSPDLLVVFFFFLTLNGILFNNFLLISVGSIGLCLFSTRGAMFNGVLGLFYMSTHFKNLKWSYFIGLSFGLCIFVLFQYYHFSNKGWILYHENSPWIECFRKVDFMGFVRNIIILVWRLCDNGRLFTMLLLLPAFWHFRKQILTQKLFTLLFFCILIVVFPLLLHKNLLGHRYLLVVFLLVDVIVLIWINSSKLKPKVQIVILIFCIIVQISGHFWIYPDKIAKGWDASLAYIPYIKLEKEACDFLSKQGISKDKVVSETPFCQKAYYTNLNMDTTVFVKANGNLRKQFVLYSNVINTFSDEQIDSLQNESFYKPIFTRKSIQVKLVIYQKI